MKPPPLQALFLYMPFFIAMHNTTYAQDTLAGEYYLRGVMETASGFKLNADSTFQFFFSYGALDRYGEGKWAVKNDHIVFNSRPAPGKDFLPGTARKASGNFTTIRIIEKNPMLLSHVACIVKAGNHTTQQVTDKEGFARFPRQAIDSISLIFEFCPERTTTFAVTDKAHNYFEFSFEPWLFEVFFENFNLSLQKDQLTGAHPLLTGASYSYEKNPH